MDLYIEPGALQSALGWTPADWRTIRRCLQPDIKTARAARINPRKAGRSRELFEVESILEWLDAAMPGIRPHQKESIVKAATEAA